MYLQIQKGERDTTLVIDMAVFSSRAACFILNKGKFSRPGRHGSAGISHTRLACNSTQQNSSTLLAVPMVMPTVAQHSLGAKPAEAERRKGRKGCCQFANED